MSFMTPRQRICLAAISRQSLVRDGAIWRFGRSRRFGHATVLALIERGLARRIGDRVIGILVANDNGVQQ